MKTEFDHLRPEAESVKDCFTRFSFQALTLAAVAFGFIFAYQDLQPLVVLGVIPVIGVLATVCRIGTYKYSTANRHFGYELHLSRVARSPLQEEYESIGWEESLRAWRILQPAVFRRVYDTPEAAEAEAKKGSSHRPWRDAFSKDLYRRAADTETLLKVFRDGPEPSDLPSRQRGNPYPWFMPKLLADPDLNPVEGPKIKVGSLYHAGSYLRTMVWVLVAAQYFAVLPLVVGILSLDKSAGFPLVVALGGENVTLWAIAAVSTFLVLALCYAIRMRQKRIFKRVDMLENEVLSIHSCAIIWQAVALAHLVTMHESDGSYTRYTEGITRQAVDLHQNAFCIHDWIATTERNLIESIKAKSQRPA